MISVRVTGYAAAAIRHVAETDPETAGKLLPEELAAQAAYHVLNTRPPELWQFNFSPGVRWSYQRADDDRPFDVTPSDTIMRAAREFAERRGADISPADVIRRAIWYAACHEGLSQLVNEARFRELENYGEPTGPPPTKPETAETRRDGSETETVERKPRKTGTITIPEQRMFILGAGFSAPAGLPLGPNLLQGVRDDVKEQFNAAGWDGTLEQEINEWRTLYPGQRLDLEHVLAYTHRRHYLRLIRKEQYFEHGSRTIDAARRAIQKLLISATPKTTPDLYLDFAKRLRPDDVVVTFNYDTLLEKALDDARKPYTLTPEWWLEDGFREAPVAQHIDVLKLHGSIDWYDREYHDAARRWLAEQGHSIPNRHPLFGYSPSVPTESLAKGVVREFGTEILRRVRRVPNHPAHYPIPTRWGTIVPVILPPAHDKLLGYSPILDLWENLHIVASMASAIIVIGYSMPSYDSHAYEAVGQLLVTHQRGDDTTQWGHRRVPVQIIALDKCGQAVGSRYPFLNHSQTRIWHQGFSTRALEWLDWGDNAG